MLDNFVLELHNVKMMIQERDDNCVGRMPDFALTAYGTTKDEAEAKIHEGLRFLLSPNPPMDTDGRRENSGRGVRELQGRWPGLRWGREVGERRVFRRRTGHLWPSADVGQGKMAGRGRSKRHSHRVARVGGDVGLTG